MDALSSKFANISQLNMKNRAENSEQKAIKTNFTEKITKEEALELKAQIGQKSQEVMLRSVSLQTQLDSTQVDFTKLYEEFQDFLGAIGYEGKAIAELSQEEAAELISEDGIFGIKQTSERIANFIIDNAGGNEDRLRAGREGMLAGFKEAERLWGTQLPEISQETMQKSIELVDKAMSDLGFSLLNQEA